MKKFITLLAVMAMLLVSLTGCSKGLMEKWSSTDGTPAHVGITTSTGYSVVKSSYNYTDDRFTGMFYALGNKTTLYLDEEECAYIHFTCTQCEYEEELELIAPQTALLTCNCSDDDDALGLKEYFCIEVLIPDSESCAETKAE